MHSYFENKKTYSMKIKFLLPFIALSLYLGSCKNDTTKKVEGSTVEANAPTGPTTTIKFSEEEFNFGKVMQGDVVEHSFEFKNTGKEPLIISDCKASCGCTIPEWPRDPVAPGATAKITAKFNTTGKSNEQKKVITVTANTEPYQSFISLSGFVEVPADAKKDEKGKEATH